MKDFKHWGVKLRALPDYNYKAIWNNLKTIRLGESVDDIIELPPSMSEFYDVGLNTMCNAECSFCLPSEEQIYTSKGLVKIKEVNIGDLVYSFDENTGNIELNSVSQKFERDYNGELIELELENGVLLKLTPNHKVYTLERGWIEANNLQCSDTLLEI